MIREVIFFATAASLLATVFFVSLFELIFTMRRRKINKELQSRVRELKATYNQSVNELVIKDDSTIEEREQQLEEASAKLDEEKAALEKEFQEKIEGITAKSQKEVDAAKAKAKKLQEEAKLQADQYLAARKEEVEADLMNLVIAVTKKVLPEGISYEAHKDLVLQALRDIKTDSSQS